MSTLAHTTTGPARWHPTRVTAALLSFCAVVLVIIGSFLPLYSGTLSVGPDEIEVTISPWSADIRGTAEPGDVPTIGYPLVFAAIVLACAAALCWYAATPAAGQGVGRVSALTTAIGAAFLIGTVWTTALMVTNGVDSVILLGTVTPGLETEATYLVGYWLLLVAALLGVAAAALALIPVRQATWAQINPDVSTPPYGIAMAVPPPQQNLFQVDPLTGHPLHPSPPHGAPVAYPLQVHQPPSPVGQPFGAQPWASEPPVAEPSAAPPLAAQPPVAPPLAAKLPAAPPPADQAPVAELPVAQTLSAQAFEAQPSAVRPPAAQPLVAPPFAAEPPTAPPLAAQPAAAQAPVAEPSVAQLLPAEPSAAPLLAAQPPVAPPLAAELPAAPPPAAQAPVAEPPVAQPPVAQPLPAEPPAPPAAPTPETAQPAPEQPPRPADNP